MTDTPPPAPNGPKPPAWLRVVGVAVGVVITAAELILAFRQGRNPNFFVLLVGMGWAGILTASGIDRFLPGGGP